MKELFTSSIDYYLLPNKIFCSMAGMWPIDEKSSLCKKLFAYLRLIFALTAVSSVFIPEILVIAVNWGDLKVLAGVGCVLTTVGQLLFKMFYLLARKDKAYSLYNELRDLWNTSNTPTEKQSYESLAYWARLCTIVFYSSCMCNVLTFTIAAAFDYIKIEYINNGTKEDLHLPFDVWYGTDITDFPCFEIAFICQVIASLVCCAGISGIDASFMTIILHVCGQFKLINTWITNMGAQINSETIHVGYSQKLQTNLIKCIRHHQRMIDVVKKVNNLLTPIIFVQLLTSGIEICLSGFAVTDNGTGADLIKFISYLISMAIQLLLWCWPGEILVHESQQIGYVIYSNIPWYLLPPAYQKQLCLMIVRSQQHCSITALTFQTLSFHTLTTVFNTAASYFTLLRQMHSSKTNLYLSKKNIIQRFNYLLRCSSTSSMKRTRSTLKEKSVKKKNKDEPEVEDIEYIQTVEAKNLQNGKLIETFNALTQNESTDSYIQSTSKDNTISIKKQEGKLNLKSLRDRNKNNEEFKPNTLPPKNKLRAVVDLKMMQEELKQLEDPPSNAWERKICSNRLPFSFFDTPCEELAQNLLGKILVRYLENGTVLKGRIVETEGYLGIIDKASHTYQNKVTPRNIPMYMPPGTIYVYMTYGMYHCFNISSQEPGAYVLIKAVEPILGFDYMELLRNMQSEKNQKEKRIVKNVKRFKQYELCNSPSKICAAFVIDEDNFNEKKIYENNNLWIECDPYVKSTTIVATPTEFECSEWKMWRYYVLGSASVTHRDIKSEEHAYNIQ
ncbi:uncharacterized protein LOC143179584 [Calliopsis andreniformis]|uniref:uncharacterized protein LOC143179584 n=1 Tax=Calliopsis andreniformis TaxID=337506 RepID=UPI003FCDE3AE